MSDRDEGGEEIRIRVDLLQVKNTWGWRCLYAAAAAGMIGGIAEIPFLAVASLPLLVIGMWMINSFRHDMTEQVISHAYTRLIALEKLAGVEYVIDRDGAPEMRFRGKVMSLIALEDLAEKMKDLPLDLGDDEEMTDAGDA
jgi:hypothetical protein